MNDIQLSELKQHPQRQALAAELHERPFVPLRSPCQVTYLAWKQPATKDGVAHRYITDLCERAGGSAPRKNSNYHYVELDGMGFRWERHTEFASLTLFCHQPGIKQPILPGWLGKPPGVVLSATRVHLHTAPTPRPDGLDEHSICSSQVGGGLAQVWTDFRIDEGGYCHLHVVDKGMDAEVRGRLIQRLLELEAYRSIALYGFAKAKAIRPQLDELDRGLVHLTERMNVSAPKAMLDELLVMSAKAERLAAETNFRFAATRAYARIVNERCAALKERELHGLQTIGEFIERRFLPAMRTCEASERRREILSDHLARAVNLLNIHLSTAVEEQNRAQLEAMSDRARRALHLQETVEGLSIIAISYYGVGLIGYASKLLKPLGLPVDPNLVKAIAVPIVLLFAWFGLRRLRRSE